MSLALGDGYFNPNKKKSKEAKAVLLVGRFSYFSLIGLYPAFFTVDGTDGTLKVIDVLTRAGRANVFLIDGIVHAGFNFIDPREVNARTGMPVIVFQRRLPDMLSVYSALERHFEDWKERWKLLNELSTFNRSDVGNFFFAAYGIESERAKEVILRSLIVSDYPEQIRQARALAKAVGKFLENRFGGAPVR
ncbi:MAG: DUF99 family protein [Thermoprotei archaeon]